MKRKSNHWADIYAERIVREKGEKPQYVCASGITPSGTVHIGNFREVISVDLGVRALRDSGKKVRFIYSWDDYDVFRKVPSNMPDRDRLETFLRKPITMTPDPYNEMESFARRNEVEVEELLPLVGIKPDFIYQAEAYRRCVYAEQIKQALEKQETIRSILNEHRQKPLDEGWWPITIFCNRCLCDTVTIENWDGDYGISYSCESCGNSEEIDLRKPPGCTKLLWRIDWPMRWAKEDVDFEPAGKDHHSEGGSFDTARRIVREVYGHEPPVSFQYDFIGIKGRGGKISSSTGEVVGLRDVLEVYQPEVVRYLFAGTRPNSEFSISFDLDVIKIYEDYDRCERIYFGIEAVSEKRRDKEARIYELSQVEEVPRSLPLQVSFRHLCSLVQIHEGRIDDALVQVEKESKVTGAVRLETRIRCAWNWVRNYAPENFRFHLRSVEEGPVEVDETGRSVLERLKAEVKNRFEDHDEKSLSEAIYSLAQEAGIAPKELFRLMYRILIDKESGPRLAGFMLNIGKERVLELLSLYV
jgi:lysyl-tRNA synthetase class 1